jgi:DNA-3-methyladenine glycosylase I
LERRRCPWATTALLQQYHDAEWGVPVHDDRTLFEYLTLEGAQAGLSWQTVLQRREAYRRAFDNFDPQIVSQYDQSRIERLLADSGIIRNRLKIEATVTNARAFLKIQEEFGSFDQYIWRFVDGRPRVNTWASAAEVPARTAESDAMSRDLQRRGFKFVGSTICYAFMQATGMVNDHLVTCFRHDQVAGSVS